MGQTKIHNVLINLELLGTQLSKMKLVENNDNISLQSPFAKD